MFYNLRPCHARETAEKKFEKWNYRPSSYISLTEFLRTLQKKRLSSGANVGSSSILMQERTMIMLLCNAKNGT
jgi:hypothetical protein